MSSNLSHLGTWIPGAEPAYFEATGLLHAIARLREPTHVVREGQTGRLGVAFAGQVGSKLAPTKEVEHL